MRRINKVMAWLLLMIMVFVVNGNAGTRNFNDGIELRNDKIFLDGEKFFIYAVGYAPWRPGQWPGKDTVDLELIEKDFKRIKDAGFNAVRTWDALRPEELALAEKFGLKVVQGIWLDPSHDFSDGYFVRDSLDYISKVVKWSKGFKCIIMYLVITEPKQDSVIFAGGKKVNEFFKKIKQTIQTLDNKPVSMDSWIPLGYMDHSMWDIVTFNAFMFVPESINKTIGFDEYLAWIKQKKANDKPLFIGETGGFSVSKQRFNDLGFGGNTERQQSQGDIESVKKSIAAGAAGATVVSWIDTWHYPEKPMSQGEDPWEWDGIIRFENLSDSIGKPREVYYSLKEFSAELENLLRHREPMNEKKIYNIHINRYSKDETLGTITIELRDELKRPIKDSIVDVGLFLPVGWQEEVKRSKTDELGISTLVSDLRPEPVDQYLIISLGIYEKNSRLKHGDIVFYRLNLKKQAQDNKFYIYHNENSYLNHFYPTGWIGDYEDLEISDLKTSTSKIGACLKIAYSAKGSLGGGWAGIYWQYPAFNWDEGERAINLSGFKYLTFMARGESGGEVIEEIGFGGNAPNSTKVKIGPIKLGKEWQKYSISLKDNDLSKIINGFYFFVIKKSNPNGSVFYLDEICFL